MSFVNFIDFNTDKDTAISIRTSPVIQFHKFNGVQLLPNNPFPYVQSTNVSGGIELEDWTAYVIDSCTEIETDITEYFSVDRIFQDENGQAQFDWSITNVPVDFGTNLVYLRVEQSIGETFYSNVFQFTSVNDERTCRLDYKNSENDTMQSVQVQMYYWQDLKQTEINSYYEVSTRNTVTTLVKSQKFQRWATDFLPNFIMIKIDDVFENKFVYVDLVRTNLFEANEIQEFTEEENFKSNIIKLSQIKSDVYDPLYTPPLVIDLKPEITLNSVIANGTSAIYNFVYQNFTPTSLIFETSQNQIDWNSTENTISSPFSLPFTGTGVWFFRIRHPESVSNIVELDLGSSVVAVDNSVNISPSQVVDIPVLSNDVLVGNTTIISVTNPANGTTEIIENGTRIRYTHSGNGTTDSFNYTISNGITSDTATVFISVFVQGSPFGITEEGYSTSNLACSILPQSDKFYRADQNGSPPGFGDVVYNDQNLTSLFNGGNLYYSTEEFKAIRIAQNGVITDIRDC